MRILDIETIDPWFGIVLTALLLATPGCLVRKVSHARPSEAPPSARDATLEELVSKINARSEAVRTLSATVDLEPTAGSVYSGVIKEYHDVKAFILLERPATIRIIGQAPVVRTTIFDMVSNGEEFRLYIPSQQKFIVGKTTFRHTARNALENLRPQHVLEAMLVSPIDPKRESPILEQAERRSLHRRYYVVDIIEAQSDRHLILRRKVWFDRADLELVRTQFFDPDGSCTEDVEYSAPHDFQGTRYPSRVQISRPVEDYELSITIEKAMFNQPITPDKFDLRKPEGAQLIDLNASQPQEKSLGK